MPLPFEQQSNESAKAFAAFALYLSLGPQRSLPLVAQQCNKSVSLMGRWSARFNWSARVQAHAAHLAIVEREVTEALTRTKAAQWLTRREDQKDDEWAWRSELIAASREALKPFRERGKLATLGDIARAIDLASKLGRLATGMATDHTELTGADSGPIQIELTAALNKIYGPAVDVEEVPVTPLPPPEPAP